MTATHADVAEAYIDAVEAIRAFCDDHARCANLQRLSSSEVVAIIQRTTDPLPAADGARAFIRSQPKENPNP